MAKTTLYEFFTNEVRRIENASRQPLPPISTQPASNLVIDAKAVSTSATSGHGCTTNNMIATTVPYSGIATMPVTYRRYPPDNSIDPEQEMNMVHPVKAYFAS